MRFSVGRINPLRARLRASSPELARSGPLDTHSFALSLAIDSMTNDTPTRKAPPSEPTTAPATTRPEGENADAAIAMVGRPTPSPDQFLPQTGSSAKSDDSSSPNASGDVGIGSQPSIDYTPDGKDDATSPCYAATTREDNADSFISTPSPFKNQAAALAGVKEGTCEKIKRSLDASDNEGQEYMDLPPPPGQISTPAAFSMSNYRRDRLLSEALIHSPDPLLNDANVTDYDLLDREVMAAASTASAMLSRSDGFDPMPGFPGIGRNGGSGMYDGGTMAATRFGGLDMSQFFIYPTQDAFPLPSILQAHLDETFVASTLVLEQIRNADREGAGGTTANNGQVFFQVTAYRPRGGGGVISAPGTTPPAVSASSPRYREGGTDIDFDIDNVGRGKTLEQLSHLPNQSAASQNSKKKTNATARPRPLPLRKRKLKVYADSDDEEYTAPAQVVVAELPADNKRALVRHNMRSDNERITCRCMKSQCLKLYCDCFQQSLVSRCFVSSPLHNSFLPYRHRWQNNLT